MNGAKYSFFKYIEETRDCGDERLERAVNRGIVRARNSRLDSRRLVFLAAASVFTAAMCFAVNLGPFKSAAESYYRSRRETMPYAAVALDGYIKDIAEKIETIELFGSAD